MGKKLIHGSTFSGIGAAEIAAEMLGWENAFHCEINPFGRAVLDYYFKNAKSYEDITKTDFSEWRGKIDVLTGGFPCQPFSYAGKRKGSEDDRYLWPYMLKCIEQVRPTWFIGENVAGIRTMVFPGEEVEVASNGDIFEEAYIYRKEEGYVLHEICESLGSAGYSVQPFIIPACAVGAPHRRDRVFIIAHRTLEDPLRSGCGNGESESQSDIGRFRKPCAGSDERICGEEMAGSAFNTESEGLEAGHHERGCGIQQASGRDSGRNGADGSPRRTASDSHFGGEGAQGESGCAEEGGGHGLEFTSERSSEAERPDGLPQFSQPTTDTENVFRNGDFAGNGEHNEAQKSQLGGSDSEGICSRCSSDTKRKGLERTDESRCGEGRERMQVWGNPSGCGGKDMQFNRDASYSDSRRMEGLGHHTEECYQGDSGQPSESDFSKVLWDREGLRYLLPQNRWRSFPTQSPIYRGNDGIPFDVDNLTISFGKWKQESLKAYGNAIVPQVMYEIFRCIDIIENGT